jgi:(S)-3,5-dihydroxyphenylglycine transaminase
MTILMAGLFNPAEDVLLVSDPTYIGITGIATILGIELCFIPNSEDGFDLGALKDSVQNIRERGKNPKALYVIPDFNNPLGTSMPIESRRRLLDIAQDCQILIFEDNPYGMFAYDGDPEPTLKSLDHTGIVIYLGTFSKILFPGLRIGFMVADQEVIQSTKSSKYYLAQELSKVKSLTSLNTSPILQAILGGILLANNCSLAKIVRNKIDFYRSNRNSMIYYLKHYFNTDFVSEHNISWSYPHGGFFLTLTLPFIFDEEKVQICAEKYGVIGCPMSFFSLLPGRENQIRLSFSCASPSDIEQGIGRLWKFVHDTVMNTASVQQ